jgi:LDH2 family malate/lactate/ureidoglycolate dehydrogenase
LITKSFEEVYGAVEKIVIAAGTPKENARVVAQLLAGSHLAGHDSHGIQHLPRYIREVRAGEIVANACPELLSQTDATALVRGNWAWGHVTADFITQIGIQKARKAKVALVSGVEVNHIGRLGHYSEQAAKEGIVTILASGGNAEEVATAAPFGGKKSVLSPNPIAMGFPTSGDGPVIVDFAATQVAGGKIAAAKAKGEQLPPGWIIDKQGDPSISPDDYYAGGSLLPFGAHKGFGIMVAMEIMGRILAGADAYSKTTCGGVHFRHCGVSLIAIDCGVFSSRDCFFERTRELASRIRAVPPAPGVAAVMAPGDFEQQMRTRRLQEGIQVPESTWSEIVQTADSLGVQL